MADTKISQLPEALPLTGEELSPVVQTVLTIPVTAQTTAQKIANRSLFSVLTGFVSGAGSVSASDTILTAIEKIVGNISELITGVSSVNGETGIVELTTDNIPDGDDTKQFTNANLAKLDSIGVPRNLHITDASTNLTEAQNGTVFNNKNSVAQTVFVAPASIAEIVQFEFVNMEATGLRFQVQSGCFVYFAGGMSSDGGFIEISDIGCSFGVTRINATDWIVDRATSGSIVMG